MIKNKSLFKNISLFLCLVPMLLLSLFCLVPQNTILNVFADNTSYNSTFNGSNLNFVINGFGGVGVQSFGQLTSDNYLFLSYRFKLDYNNGVVTPSFNGIYNSTYYLYNGSNDFGANGFNPLTSFNYNVPNVNIYRYYIHNNTRAETFVGFSYYNENNDYTKQPTLTMQSVEFSNYTQLNNLNENEYFYNSSISNGYFNFISYLDTAGYRYNFFIPSCYQSYYSYNESPYYYYSYRLYNYFLASELPDNTVYQQGYTDGYNNGVSDGSNSGYQDGYSAGQTIGYQDGYSAGIEQGGNYTFLGLIGAVIDAPVSAFTSLLNFNILGVNILSFVTGLLTLALIIFIIKLCMGGK